MEPSSKLAFLSLAASLLLAGCGTSVAPAGDPWAEADRIVAGMSQVDFPDYSVDITSFGAVPGDSLNLAGEAINLAILDVNQKGGGTVLVPDGVFYTGPITMKSNVRLHLSDNATLKFVPDVSLYMPAVLTRWEGLDCYNAHPLIYAYGETNIAITGKGTIDGGADPENWWNRQKEIERSDFRPDPAGPLVRASRLRLLDMGENHVPVNKRIFDETDCLRPQTINFYRCTTVLIEGVTLINSPFWVIHPLLCTDLVVRSVTIVNDGPNGDGCDPESCRNVLIEDCVFDTGDDCIAIKSGRNEDGRKWNIPSENIIVRNCTMADGHGGVVIGSEITGGFRNLFVENCRMSSPNLDRVIRIKTSTARGGLIENIYVRNVEVGQCRESVLRINLNYEPNEKARRGFYPEVRNVQLENVHCNASEYGLWLYGFDDRTNISGISLKNCSFEGVKTGGNHVRGMVGDIELKDCTINGSAFDSI